MRFANLERPVYGSDGLHAPPVDLAPWGSAARALPSLTELFIIGQCFTLTRPGPAWAADQARATLPRLERFALVSGLIDEDTPPPAGLHACRARPELMVLLGEPGVACYGCDAAEPCATAAVVAAAVTADLPPAYAAAGRRCFVSLLDCGSEDFKFCHWSSWEKSVSEKPTRALYYEKAARP